MLTLRRSIQPPHSCPFQERLQTSGLPLPAACSSNTRNPNRPLLYRHFPTPTLCTRITRITSPIPGTNHNRRRGASATTFPPLHSPKPNHGQGPPAKLKPTSPTRNPTHTPVPTCAHTHTHTQFLTQTPTHPPIIPPTHDPTPPFTTPTLITRAHTLTPAPIR